MVYASMAMPAAAFADDVDMLCAPEADEAAYDPAPRAAIASLPRAFAERAAIAPPMAAARPAAAPAKKLAPPAPPAFAASPAFAPAPAALFARQLADGLWQDDRADDEGHVAATERALAACAAQGIDSAHAVYGAQVKKAVEALCALARGPHAAPVAALRTALEAALRVASGRRLLAEVKAAIQALPTHG
jgi:Ca-activated chloride channel family protein